MKRAAFIINSPFQAICALEAMSHYEVQFAFFYMFDTQVNHRMVAPLIDGKGSIVYIKHQNEGTIHLIKLLNSSVKERFDDVFIGDYFSFSNYVVALHVANFRAQFRYLDDGNSTLAITPPISRQRPRSRSEKQWYVVLEAYRKMKSIKSSLFTIYELGSGCPLSVEHNDFNSLVPNEVASQKGIYVIGTNTSAISLRGNQYEYYLKSIDRSIRERCYSADVYYCPHRRDNNDWTTVVDSLGWKVFDTEISVEVDFVRCGIYPLEIIGFGSTALFTLKKIFPQSDVYTIVMELQNESDNKTYREIETYYEQNGILSIVF